jgi:hypothetical protein
MSNETQIAIDASTYIMLMYSFQNYISAKVPLVGANQRIILCSILELSEQMMPMMMSRRMASRTVCKALLDKSARKARFLSRSPYGEKE